VFRNFIFKRCYVCFSCNVISHTYITVHTHTHTVYECLSYDRSVASSKPSSPPSGIECFLFLFPVSCLFQGQSSYLRLLPRIPVTYLHPSIFPSITSATGRSCAKCDQSIYPSLCLSYAGYSSTPLLSVTLLHFSHDRSS